MLPVENDHDDTYNVKCKGTDKSECYGNVKLPELSSAEYQSATKYTGKTGGIDYFCTHNLF